MSKSREGRTERAQTFEGEHGRPLTKKNWRSVPVLPQPTANFDIRPRTLTSFALLRATIRHEHARYTDHNSGAKTYLSSWVFPRRRSTAASTSTLKSNSRSTRLSSAFGLQIADTEARVEGVPSVRSWLLFFLRRLAQLA